jgi:hypothetical protein
MIDVLHQLKGFVLVPPKPESDKARSLRVALQAWFEKNDLADENTSWRRPKQRSKADLVLAFGPDLYRVLWCLPFEVGDPSDVIRLRGEFDAVVNEHGFVFKCMGKLSGTFTIAD